MIVYYIYMLPEFTSEIHSVVEIQRLPQVKILLRFKQHSNFVAVSKVHYKACSCQDSIKVVQKPQSKVCYWFKNTQFKVWPSIQKDSPQFAIGHCILQTFATGQCIIQRLVIDQCIFQVWPLSKYY